MNLSIIGSVLGVAIPAGYFLLIGRGHLAEVDAAYARIDVLHAQREIDEAEAQRLGGFRAEHASLRAWLDELRPRVAGLDGTPSLLLMGSKMLREQGLQIVNARIVPSTDAPPFRRERVHFEVAGSFLDVARFIRRIEGDVGLHRVVDLSVESSAGVRDVRAEVVIERRSLEGS